MAESLHGSPETITTLSVGSTLIFKKSQNKIKCTDSRNKIPKVPILIRYVNFCSTIFNKCLASELILLLL